MSAVTNQPLPFGRLEREKHIQMIFRAFQNHCGPSHECQTHSPGPKPHRTPPDWESDEQLSGRAPVRKMENGYIQPLEKVNWQGMEEQNLGGAAGSDFTSVLETVSRIHISARPELQGKKKLVCKFVILCVEKDYCSVEISLPVLNHFYSL